MPTGQTLAEFRREMQLAMEQWREKGRFRIKSETECEFLDRGDNPHYLRLNSRNAPIEFGKKDKEPFMTVDAPLAETLARMLWYFTEIGRLPLIANDTGMHLYINAAEKTQGPSMGKYIKARPPTIRALLKGSRRLNYCYGYTFQDSSGNNCEISDCSSQPAMGGFSVYVAGTNDNILLHTVQAAQMVKILFYFSVHKHLPSAMPQRTAPPRRPTGARLRSHPSQLTNGY